MYALLQWNSNFLDLNHAGICSRGRQNEMAPQRSRSLKLGSAKTERLLSPWATLQDGAGNELRLHPCVPGPKPQTSYQVLQKPSLLSQRWLNFSDLDVSGNTSLKGRHMEGYTFTSSPSYPKWDLCMLLWKRSSLGRYTVSITSSCYKWPGRPNMQLNSCVFWINMNWLKSKHLSLIYYCHIKLAFFLSGIKKFGLTFYVSVE